MNELKIKFNPLYLLIVIFTVLLPISLFVETNYRTTLLTYTDEVLTILSAIYIIYTSFKKKIRGIDLALLITFVIMCFLTLLGNVFSRVVTNKFPILLDILALSKVFIPFIAIRKIATKDTKKQMLKMLVPFSKLFLITSTLCGTISLFFDIGMSGEKRYGIPAFAFVFVIPHYFGYFAAGCLLAITSIEKNRYKIIAYEIMFALDIIYTTKGIDYIVLVIFIILLIMWRKNDKFTPLNVIVLLIAGVVTSQFQISEYITNSNSPRMILIKYGIKTANTYFPFGAGFAAYGSDMAARYYSPLYVKYGFEKVWGLSQTHGSFLNDGYINMLFGELGYFGTVLFVVCIGIITSMIYKIKTDKKVKALSMAIILGLLISCIGSAIIRSSTGMFVLTVLAIVTGYSNQDVSPLKNKQI